MQVLFSQQKAATASHATKADFTVTQQYMSVSLLTFEALHKPSFDQLWICCKTQICAVQMYTPE